MTQAVAMLRSLIALEREWQINKVFGVHIQTVRRLASERTEPNWEIISKLSSQIPPVCWFDEASEEFIDDLEEATAYEKERLHIKNTINIRNILEAEYCYPEGTLKDTSKKRDKENWLNNYENIKLPGEEDEDQDLVEDKEDK